MLAAHTHHCPASHVEAADPLLPPSPAPQLLLSKKSGRGKKNGDPKWEEIAEFAIDDQAPTAMLYTDLAPGVVTCLAANEEGGGGHTLAGSKHGHYSALRGTVTWTLRCKSCTAWGCINQKKVVANLILKEAKVFDATGWPHTHSGILLTKRGLPPQIKVKMDKIIFDSPSIKLGALRLMLYNQGASKEMKQQIADRFYHLRATCPTQELGVSSFGTLMAGIAEHDIHKLLAQVGANENTTGVIGSYVDVDTQTAIVAYSSVKGAMMAFEQQEMGYDEGLVSMDFTYKVVQERIPCFTITTHDIAQHGKLLSFGLSTHETGDAAGRAQTITKKWTNFVLGGILSETLPEVWSAAFKALLYKSYKGTIHGTSGVWDPKAGLGDCAPAIEIGTRAAHPGLLQFKHCNSHVLGVTTGTTGVINQAKRLITIEGLADEVIESVKYIHLVPQVLQKVHT